MLWGHYSRNLIKQVRTPPVRPADGVVVVGRFYESFVPGEVHRGLGLRGI